MISLGFITTVKSDSVLYFLCIALDISILADGLFKMQIAIDAKRFGIGAWWLIVALAVVAGAVGLLLVFRPAESLRHSVRANFPSDGFETLCTFIVRSSSRRYDSKTPLSSESFLSSIANGTTNP